MSVANAALATPGQAPTAPQLASDGSLNYPIHDGGGSGATGTANVVGGAVQSVTLISGGANYTSAPTVSIPGGTGAAQTAAGGSPNQDFFDVQVDGDDLLCLIETLSGGTAPTVSIYLSWR